MANETTPHSMINSIRAQLKSKLGACYYWKEAPENADFPYRVAFLAQSSDDTPTDVFMLNLDYVGNGKQWETIYETINSDMGDGDPISPTGLNNMHIRTENGSASLYYDQTALLEDAEKELQFIRVTYQVRVFRRK